MSKVVRLSDRRKRNKQVCFTRLELNKLLSVYSRRVIRGEWKDYAIDLANGCAAFSVFAGSRTGPVFTVVKYAAPQKSGAAFAVYDGRRRIRQGASLSEVLPAIERDLKLVSP